MAHALLHFQPSPLPKLATPMITDVTDRKVNAMAEWADVLMRGAHDALKRMDTTLTLAEAKVAMVRELIAKRHSESGLLDTDR
jgi:hypothetical protein